MRTAQVIAINNKPVDRHSQLLSKFIQFLVFQNLRQHDFLQTWFSHFRCFFG